ncbi:transglycosylase domain-containing protein, partial [Streptomyces vietnamensis]
TSYFGRNAYGIQAAARAYYGKDVDRLDTAEDVHGPGGTFLLRPRQGQLSSWATARRASASRTPQLISCSVRTEGDWS